MLFVFLTILTYVTSQSVEQTTPTISDITTANALISNKGKVPEIIFSGNINKTDNSKKRKFKVRNQTKLYKLKKLLLETETKNATNDKILLTTKKTSENSTETANTLKYKTKNQLLILQKELRRLTKIAEKLSELNEINTVTKQTPIKKKPDVENKGKKSFNGKKGVSNKHKPHLLKNHNGDNDSGKKSNDQMPRNKINDENKLGKFKVGKKRPHTTAKSNVNATTISPLEKRRIVTSHINTKQSKRKTTKKNDTNTFHATVSTKHLNTSFPPTTTVPPEQ